MENKHTKMVIYQVFTRLFGNSRTPLHANGTIDENGCGKMADFTTEALNAIQALGVSHIWYTGIIEHATQTDYTAYGIRRNHPAVVKGRAGSPYAIKDYYDVDPDLAVSVPHRMQEFTELVKRTHQAGLKVIIDFVPNHVARQYHSDAKPAGVTDLGETDRTEMAFSPANNFYYIPGIPFSPAFDLTQGNDEAYHEVPAKATGNDRFDACPGINDWYETVKLNYGVDYCNGHACHFDPVPDTWSKMLDILLFWAAKEVDGFRCDMAEMVPIEFWGWIIPRVKARFPHVIFIAEVYNPAQYRNYIYNGRFDYLYDKVGLYDTLRAVTCGQAPASCITSCWQQVEGITEHMLNFLENHDEQRLASDFFAGNGRRGLPALITSACMNVNPMMVYFGQELGERGMDAEGFSGRDGRTTIFDYWNVDTINRWRNGGRYDDTLLRPDERDLQKAYAQVLNLCRTEAAIAQGTFFDLMYVNYDNPRFNSDKQYAFLRKHGDELLVVIANFDEQSHDIELNIPIHAFECLHLVPTEQVTATDLLTEQNENVTLSTDQPLRTSVEAWNGKILKIKL